MTMVVNDADGRAPKWSMRSVMAGQSIWIGLIFVALVILFTVISGDAFASLPNARNILAGVAIMIIISLGQMMVILTAGIDLSIGGVLVFSGVVAAMTMNAFDGSVAGILLGLLAAMVSGVVWGFINGFLVTKARIPPIIATLGTLGMSMGLALVLTSGIDLRAPLPLVEGLGSSTVLSFIPWIAIIALALAGVVALILSQTVFGRHTYAIGASAPAAERSGINVTRHLITVYAVAGLLVGIAAFVSLARFGTTTLSGHAEDALKAITAVVLGGTSLFGGIGVVRGVVLGAFIPVILLNGFVIAGVQAYWQQFAIGLVLVVAVYIDRRRHATAGPRRRAKKQYPSSTPVDTHQGR
ncbi:ABC transporter permease [Microbacterium aurum]